jgi:hypothetical protein
LKKSQKINLLLRIYCIPLLIIDYNIWISSIEPVIILDFTIDSIRVKLYLTAIVIILGIVIYPYLNILYLFHLLKELIPYHKRVKKYRDSFKEKENQPWSYVIEQGKKQRSKE